VGRIRDKERKRKLKESHLKERSSLKLVTILAAIVGQ
jgi:hypothetical protein